MARESLTEAEWRLIDHAIGALVEAVDQDGLSMRLPLSPGQASDPSAVPQQPLAGPPTPTRSSPRRRSDRVQCCPAQYPICGLRRAASAT
jgi:hypothetical protein